MGGDLPAARRHRRLKASSGRRHAFEVGTNSSDRGLQRLALLGAAPRLVPSLSKHWRGDPIPSPWRSSGRIAPPARGLPSSAIRCHRPRVCIRALPKAGRRVFLWRGLERGLLGRALDLRFTWARIPRSGQPEQRPRHELILHSGCRYPFGEAAEERSRGGGGWS